MKKRHLYILIPAASLLLVALVCVTVYALMFQKTQSVQNDFVPASVSCKVFETVANNVKSSITIQNTGNIDAYVRVRLVSYWVDANGNVVAKSSEMPAFTVADGWIAGADNTYYYNSSIAPNAAPNLLASGSEIGLVSEDGYFQVIDVFAEAIQSLPTDAVTSAWGVTLDSNGNIVSAP